MRIVVTGLIAQYPLGGMAWHYLQYVLGLHKLGHEVYYFEDTGLWPYNPVEKGVSKSSSYNVNYLSNLMSHYGLEHRWAYRFPWQDEWFGIDAGVRQEIIESADMLINVSGTLEHPDRYRGRHTRFVYVDTDPVFTQLKLLRGQRNIDQLIAAHDVQLSFGETLANTPLKTRFDWLPTRQPIVLSEWRPGRTPRRQFTTVMNWTSYKPIEFQGKVYGQKNEEFLRFLNLPGRFEAGTFELAVNQGKTLRTPRRRLEQSGWSLADPDEVCADLFAYRDYIEGSTAEWTVAKNGYVQGWAGWFSERSACYLAAGKPVVTQDTGFSTILPCGAGLLPFSTFEQAEAAIEELSRDYAGHSEAARQIATDHFDSDKVLASLLDAAA